MGWWDEQVVPRLTDVSLSQPAVTELRRQAVAGLRGRVLEVGFGSGLNLPVLTTTIEALDAVEPSDVAWRRSAARRDAAPFPVRRIGLDGARIAAGDAEYDGALCTFTLCTIPDAPAAAAELRRVLRPGASVHLLEHGRSPDDDVLGRQLRYEPWQRRLAGGCHLARDPAALLREAGLDVVILDQRYLTTGPMAPWTYLTLATARAS